MTFLLQAAIQGTVGFAIGAGTNDPAIRWLFATVFTKKKKAIAESVQEVVSHDLMSSEKIVAQFSRPEVREAIERELRGELDAAFSRAVMFADGIAEGLRPLLPEFLRIETDAVRKVGAALGTEARTVVAKSCARRITDYLSRRLPHLIDETHVWNIIYDSIMELDEAEMEFLTRQVANRELRGITLWGGVIGAMVGVSMSIVLTLLG